MKLPLYRFRGYGPDLFCGWFMSTFSGKSQDQLSGIISNELFWPDVDLGKFVADYRPPSDLPAGTIREHLIQAITDINFRLSSFRLSVGVNREMNLADVPSENIDGESALLHLYRRAVSCRAKASICRDYPTIDRRQPAENQAKSSDETESVYLRFADEAVRQIIGMTDITVELL